VLAAAQMGTEVVRITLLHATKDVRERELLIAGVKIHGRSVDPSGYLRDTDCRRTTDVIRSRLAYSLATLTVFIIASVALVMLVGISQQGRILPGTTVAGVDVGGRDVASARRILAPVLAAEQRHPVRVSTPGRLLVLDPREVGLAVDITATADAAFKRGRTGWARSLGDRLLAPVRRVEIAPLRSVDDDLLVAWVEELAEAIGRETSVGGIGIIGEDDLYRVTIDAPRGAVRVDTAASVTVLRTALLAGERRVSIVASADLAPGGLAPIERLAGDVEYALQRPLLVRDDGRTLIITPDILVKMIEFGTANDELGRSTPTLDVPVNRVRAYLGAAGRETFDRPGRDARIVTERVPPATLSALEATVFRPVETAVRIEPSEARTRFVPALTAADITRMIASRQRTTLADLDASEPQITTADVLGRRPTHLLGTFTTFFAPGASRTVNIALLADILDDRPIAPGATFSVNETSGPRRCEDGFVPAGTIIGGELVDTCGGGVSQIGTTVMNAAFFAGVELKQWQPHSFYISRYPAGREATLTYPELDVSFRNDTESWMVLRAFTTPDSVTVSIYGVPRWDEVRASHSERRAPTDFEQEERLTTDLAPGVRRVLQSGGDGFTISVTRTRVASDASGDAASDDVSEERWTTVYRPQLRIVEVGVAPGTGMSSTPSSEPRDPAPSG